MATPSIQSTKKKQFGGASDEMFMTAGGLDEKGPLSTGTTPTDTAIKTTTAPVGAKVASAKAPGAPSSSVSSPASLDDDALDESAPAFRRARFVVSGEPFDITLEELLQWKDTTLYSGACFAMKTKTFAKNPDDPTEIIPRVEFPDDVKQFRLLRQYMKTRELIVPENSTDRQLLSVAATFYGFDDVIKLMAHGARVKPTGSAPQDAAPQGAKAADKRPSTALPRKTEDGGVMPSIEAVKRVKGVSMDAGGISTPLTDALAFFWCSGELDTLIDKDSDLRASEYRARAAFGRDEDGSDLIKTAVLLDEKVELKLKPEQTRYPHFVYPHSRIDSGKIPLVSSLSEFKLQFTALTDGALDGILEALPVVVAGGAVVAALHRLPRVEMTDDSLRGFVAKANLLFDMFSDKALAELGVLSEAKSDDAKRSPPLVVPFNSKAAPITDLAQKVKILAQKAPRVKAGLLGRVTNSMQYFRYMYMSDTGFSSKWDSILESDGHDLTELADVEKLSRSTTIWRTFLSETQKSTIRTEFEKWGFNPMLAPQLKTTPTIRIIESKGPLGYSYACIKTVMETVAKHGDSSRIQKAEPSLLNLSLRDVEIDKLALCLFMSGAYLSRSGSVNMEDSPYSSWDAVLSSIVRYKHTNQQSVNPYVRMYESFRLTDVDLFLTTRDPDAALDVVCRLHAHFRTLYGTEIKIVRTAQSVTFQLPGRNVQLISRLYHSMTHVLVGFDLDCCCIGFDGNKVVAMPRAVRALEQRTILVDPTRQSLSYESRLLKYAKRGFEIAVPGLNIEAQMSEVLRKIALWRTEGTYVGFCGVQQLIGMMHAIASDKKARRLFKFNKSDYDDRQEMVSVDNTDKPFDPVKNFKKTDRAKLSYVIGTDLASVLFSNKCMINSPHGVDTVERAADIPSMITFQSKIPHVQDRVELLLTGSFHPTSYDWYNGAEQAK